MTVSSAARDTYRRARQLSESSDHQGASALFEDAAAKFEQAGEPRYQATALVEAGRNYLRLGLTQPAVDRYKEALRVVRHSHPQDSSEEDRRQHDLTRILTNLGQALRRLGDYEDAITTLEEAMRLAADDELARAWTGVSVGAIYRDLGLTGEAHRVFADALGVFTRRHEERDAAHAAANLGAICSDLDDRTAALAYFEDARRLYDTLGDPRSAVMQANIARQHLELGNVHRALISIQDALQGLSNTEHAIWRANALTTKSSVQWAVGEQKGALATLLEAAAIFKDEGQARNHASVVGQYGGRLMALGRFDEGLEHLQAGVSELERVHDKLRSQDVRADFLNDISDAYGVLVASYVSAGRHQDALVASERSKTRTLALLITDVRGSTPVDQETERYALQRQLRSVRDQLTEAMASGTDTVRPLQRREQRLRLALRSLEVRLASSLTATPRSTAALLDDIRAAGSQATLLLEYTTGASGSVVARLGDVVESHPLPDSTLLETEISAFRDDLQLGLRPRHAHTLFDQLLGPVAHLLEATDELLIIPDGALYVLPFAALMRTPPESAPQLGERQWSRYSWLARTHSIRCAPSAQVAAALLARGGQRTDTIFDRMAVFAVPESGIGPEQHPPLSDSSEAQSRAAARYPPLPFAFDEASRICRALGYAGPLIPPVCVDGDGFAVRSHSAATKQAVVQVASRKQYRYWHFACHGLLELELFDQSGLLFAGAHKDGDAFWKAYEVAEVGLPCALATLSACDTGRGRTVRGEGVLGIARAFMVAGADTVCVSLWPVSDQHTAQLMESFYRNLERGYRKAQALRHAQLEAIAAGIHPRHWSSFVVIGAV